MKKLMKIILPLAAAISITTLPAVAASCAQTNKPKSAAQNPAQSETETKENSNADKDQSTPNDAHVSSKPSKQAKTTAKQELDQKEGVKATLLASMVHYKAKQDIMNDMTDVRSKYINDLKYNALYYIKNKEQVNNIFKDVEANPTDVSLIKPLIQKIKDSSTNITDDTFIFYEKFVYEKFLNKITPENYITLFYQLNDIYNQNKEIIANNLFKFLSFTKIEDYPVMATREAFSLDWAKKVVAKVPEFVQVFDVIANVPIYKKYNITSLEIATFFVWNVTHSWGLN